MRARVCMRRFLSACLRSKRGGERFPGQVGDGGQGGIGDASLLSGNTVSTHGMEAQARSVKRRATACSPKRSVCHYCVRSFSASAFVAKDSGTIKSASGLAIAVFDIQSSS